MSIVKKMVMMVTPTSGKSGPAFRKRLDQRNLKIFEEKGTGGPLVPPVYLVLLAAFNLSPTLW